MRTYLQIDDSVMKFDLHNFSVTDFNASGMLQIVSDDLYTVKGLLKAPKSIKVYNENTLVAEYDGTFETYDTISLEANIYVESLNSFQDILVVHMTKVNFMDRFEKIEEKVMGYVDVDKMDLEEYRDYIIGKIAEACRADIFAGTDVTLPDETVEFFTYKTEDQANILSMYMQVKLSDEEIYLPYHSHGNFTRMYSSAEIIAIYETMRENIVSKTTRANYIIHAARGAATKEDLAKISYDMDVDPNTETQVTEAVEEETSALNSINN